MGRMKARGGGRGEKEGQEGRGGRWNGSREKRGGGRGELGGRGSRRARQRRRTCPATRLTRFF
eukprot:2612697-Pyramimonas_sp.AAC.1